MNLKDFTKEDITPADLKRLGASEPKIYMHKDGKTVMVSKDQEQEYTKQGFQKSPLKAEAKVNERMPASVIKHKERLAHMTDQELADRHGDTGEETLRQMAWRHGYGKMSSHYVDRIRRAKEKVESLQEDYAKMTKALITKLVKQGKTDEEIQNATGESGLRIRLIRKSIGFDTKEKQIKVAEENARRNFMKKKHNLSPEEYYMTRSDWIAYFLAKSGNNVIFEIHNYSKTRNYVLSKISKFKNVKLIFLTEGLKDSF